MSENLPRVTNNRDYQKFFDAAKDIIDTLTGKKKNSDLDRALTVRDLEKLGIDPEVFLRCTKQNPYPL
ncbi:MAG TPA: hypothetical protein VGD14_09520 [bacterium]